MATHRIPILNFSTRPDDSGKTWFEALSVLGTNDVWKHLVGRVSQSGLNNDQLSTRVGFYGAFNVPKNFVGTAVLVIYWTGTVTSGNKVWDFDYRAISGDDAESVDQAGTQESVTGTDAMPSASLERNALSINLTSANFAVDDYVEFFLVEDGTDAADTAAGDALLLGAYFQYADV
jgi:hypothetical protein